jgi:biopolymer transport protein ExbD
MQYKIENPKTQNKSQIGQNLMIRFFCLLVTTTLILISSACSTIRLQQQQFTEDSRANLPQNITTAEEDADISKETSVIIAVNDDSGTFLIGKEKISEAQLESKISEKIKDKTPDKRIVYIESSVNVKYATIVKVLSVIRKNDVDKAGFIAFRKNYEKLGSKPSRIEVKIPAEEDKNNLVNVKPNPFILIVSIDKLGLLLLNNESAGDFTETGKLTDKLNDIFKERESNGIFREGTNEIEKTVFIKAAKSLKYGDVVKVINAVKLGNAQPIGVQIDDLSE